ncbi:MAG: hypothetical protein GBAus27B_000361 [Mycoplasmataceae bacterium]|nr:MAG: hypothetical protein GBAus27B_000361 [Mycoplasmataceae bacterium]
MRKGNKYSWWQKGLNLQQREEWIAAGAKIEDYDFAAWFRDTKQLGPEWITNYQADYQLLSERFKNQILCQLNNKSKITKLTNNLSKLMNISSKLAGKLPGGKVAETPLNVLETILNLAQSTLQARDFKNIGHSYKPSLFKTSKV